MSGLFSTLLVLTHETGHRIGAVRQLRWSDIDFEKGLVRWQAETDKIGHEHETPLTDTAKQALEAHRRSHPGIGEAFVFVASGDPSKPISRHLVRDWWYRAEELAGVERIEGRGWHSLRRKLASDLMHEPLKVLADLGGWKSTQTVVECYQRPSEKQMRAALDRRRSG